MKTTGKKILTAAMCCLLASLATEAQESPSKEINKIKRSTAYLYAEATMDSHQEAADVAYELLMKQVEEHIASKRKLSQADNVLIKDIKSKGESLSMMRGTMHRVFVYVKKSDIEGVENTTVVNAASGATITISDNPIAAVQPVATQPQTAQPVVTVPTEEVAVPAEEVAVEASTDEEEEHIFADEFQPEDPAVQARLATEGGAYLPEAGSAQGNAEAPAIAAWQQQAINSLLECADATAVRATLNRLKAQYRVKRYGTADKCPNAAGMYWVVFDDSGKLVTILGPGSTERYDYKGRRHSSLEAYKGMNALWFNLAK